MSLIYPYIVIYNSSLDGDIIFKLYAKDSFIHGQKPIHQIFLYQFS